MNSTDFDFVSGLLRRRAGIQLTTDKTYLLESRLAPLARKEGLASIEDLLSVVRSRRDERLIALIVDVMTTNETFFFRDKTPFELMKDVALPDLTAKNKSRIRIWCAACSTGQEPYSLAMMLNENPALTKGAAVEIIATDISPRVLEKAKSGLYSQFEVQRGLPIQMMMKHFKQKDDLWQISDKIRSMVTFREHNLMDQPNMFGKFDVVFIRNVLIYFDQATKSEVLDRVASVMNPGGFVLLGAAETVIGITRKFEAMKERRGLYQLAVGESKSGIRAA
ncbi:CheR family methyltransferase [Hirschia litorea]|uniref:Chemotaxis protein methyltransferase n=1 Tax=Hirschia litorea TaxID=1199156 RepID=A0ABW2IMJ8_9PROT